MIQTQENGEKPHFGPNLEATNFFFEKSGFESP